MIWQVVRTVYPDNLNHLEVKLKVSAPEMLQILPHFTGKLYKCGRSRRWICDLWCNVLGNMAGLNPEVRYWGRQNSKQSSVYLVKQARPKPWDQSNRLTNPTMGRQKIQGLGIRQTRSNRSDYAFWRARQNTLDNLVRNKWKRTSMYNEGLMREWAASEEMDGENQVRGMRWWHSRRERQDLTGELVIWRENKTRWKKYTLV